MDLSQLNSTQLEAVAYKVLHDRVAPRVTVHLLGVLFDGLLQGVIFVSFARWADRFWSKDRVIIKCLAVWTMLVGIAFTVIQFTRVVNILALNFGHYLPLIEQRYGKYLILFLFLVHIPIQVFFTERAWLISKNKGLLAVLIVMILTSIAGATASLVGFPINGLLFTKVEMHLFIATSTLVAATDLLITASMIFYLYKRKTGIQSGDRLIKRLILLSAETQLPPSIIALLLCAFDSSGNIFLSPSVVPLMTKASTIAMLVVLNARRRCDGDPESQITASASRDARHGDKGRETPALPDLSYSIPDGPRTLAYSLDPHNGGGSGRRGTCTLREALAGTPAVGSPVIVDDSESESEGEPITPDWEPKEEKVMAVC